MPRRSKHDMILDEVIPNRDTTLIKELYRAPKPEKGNNMPRFSNDHVDGMFQQADLLYLPEFNKNLYALVVVDDHSRKFDAVPLSSKTPAAVLKGLMKIYKTNKILVGPPMTLEVDNGSEFKGEFKAALEKMGVHMHVAPTNRHRSQAIVESRNGQLGKVLFQIMGERELATNKVNRNWTTHLKKLVEVMNKHVPPPPNDKPKFDDPIITKQNYKLLGIGDRVRVLLDHPVNLYNGKRLPGERRATDARWSRQVYQITDLVLMDDRPPMYVISDNPHIQRTIQQLMPVD